MSYKLRKKRNDLINQDFSRMYVERIKLSHGLQIMELYSEIAEKFHLSSMQVRRVIRGYQSTSSQVNNERKQII